MKNKLRKDLKFLRSWKPKLLISLTIALLTSVEITIPDFDDVDVFWKETSLIFLISIMLVSYVALYFFNAWLVGDEEDSDKEET